jgi:hypothetical protein
MARAPTTASGFASTLANNQAINLANVPALTPAATLT